MNYNYKRSIAELDARFRTGVDTTSTTPEDVFSTIGVYVPSYQAIGNIVGFEEADKEALKTTPKVMLLDAFNYAESIEGALLTTWGQVFNGGTNLGVKLLVTVFYAETADVADWLEVTTNTIESSYLSTVFNETFFLAYWKVLFSTKNDGNDTDDTLYFDLSLCLAQLCRDTQELSYMLSFVHLTLPFATPDTNLCHVATATKVEEYDTATALNIAIPDVEPRKRYYWGMLFRVIQAENTWMTIHSDNVNPQVYAMQLMFTTRNAAGVYIGNGLSGLRLTDALIKPTGLPSLLDSGVNQNLTSPYYETLDEKNVAYLRSIADGTGNNAVLVSEAGIMGDPVNALAIGKWIDYNTSQEVALYRTNKSTVTSPIRRTAQVYERILGMLVTNIQKFASLQAIVITDLNFPVFSDLPESKEDLLVDFPWKATFQYKLRQVTISGQISA